MDLDYTDKALLRSMSRATIGARNRQHTGARASPQTEKQSAATQRSVTADRELLQSYCRLLLDHGTAEYDAGIGVGTNILKLVSASADHEVAAMVPRQSHGAGTVRIHGIGPGEILTPTRIEYIAATDVEATQIICLGAWQGDLHDQCNYPQRQNRPEQPGLRHLGNASCEHNVLVFHKLIFLFWFLPSLASHRGMSFPAVRLCTERKPVGGY